MMNFDIAKLQTKISPVDPTTGTEFISNSLYAHGSWQSVLEQGFSTKMFRLDTSIDNEHLGSTLICSTSKFGVKMFGGPLRGTFTEYLPSMFKGGLSTDQELHILVHQMEFLKTKGALYIELGRLKGQIENEELTCLLNNLRFIYQERRSLNIDLKSGSDVLWKKFEGRARNMIRKAEKAEVEANEVRLTFQQVREFYASLVTTFERQRLRVPHPWAAYEILSSQVAKMDRLIFINASLDGQMVSAGIFLIDQDRMIFHSGTSNEVGFRTGASSLVQWRAMQAAIERGLAHYDMGGIGLESIDKFKKSFGGAVVNHHKWVYVHPLIRRAQSAIEWAQRKGLIKVFG